MKPKKPNPPPPQSDPQDEDSDAIHVYTSFEDVLIEGLEKHLGGNLFTPLTEEKRRELAPHDKTLHTHPNLAEINKLFEQL